MKHCIHLLTRVWSVMLLLLLSVACDDASSTLPTIPEMSVSEAPICFTESGGEQTIHFSTNRPWTAQLLNNLDASEQPWCTLSQESGEPGKHTLTITTAALEGDYREAILILNASATGCEIAVKQNGQPVIATIPVNKFYEGEASISGRWFYSGEMEVAESGIAIKGALAEEYAHFVAEELAADGSFTIFVEGLMSETEYVYHTYVQTADGRYFQGEELSFTTDPEPAEWSIATLKEKGHALAAGGLQTVQENAFVGGVVTGIHPNAEGLAMLFVQDNTEAHSGLTLFVDNAVAEAYTVGDRLKLRTKYGVLSHATSGQVTLQPEVATITLVDQGNTLTPTLIDHTKLADYEAMVVEIAPTQLTRLFTNAELYPTWGAAEAWNMEVENSTISYQIIVHEDAPLASVQPLTGSGKVWGRVEMKGNTAALCCEKEEQVSALSNERFESLLEMKFLAPEFRGTLFVGEEATGAVVVEYRNGDQSVLEGTISVEISATDPSILGTLAVASVTDYQLGAGSGSISFQISGVPAAEGEVTFTVVGLNDLTETTCTATITPPAGPEVGNFDGVYTITSDKKYPLVIKEHSSTNSAITLSDLTLVEAAAGNRSSTKWGDFAAQGWNANTEDGVDVLVNPAQYFTFSLTVGAGARLALSGLDITQRISGGDVELSIQYAINNGSYKEAVRTVMTEDGEGSLSAFLGAVPELCALVEGTKVDIRIVVLSTNAKTKWGMKAGERFAIYGNVE